MSELSFQDVVVRFGTARRGVTAVNKVSLTVPHGEILGLVGESGSGKSTLARACVGLVPIASGAITLDGAELTTRDRRVQMVFQDPSSSLDPRMSVGDAIAELLRTRSKRARTQEVARLLELVHLDASRAQSYPGQLSGGQRQRVAIARALACDPQVVIADEITSNLDVSIQGTILNLVRELVGEVGLTMLFISHNLAVVRYMASRVAVMKEGVIVEEGPVASVLHQPTHPYTRTLLAAIPGEKTVKIAPDHSPNDGVSDSFDTTQGKEFR